jgi:hypothetical protein
MSGCARDPRWTVHAVDSMHNVMRDAPEELLGILLGSVEDIA